MVKSLQYYDKPGTEEITETWDMVQHKVRLVNTSYTHLSYPSSHAVGWCPTRTGWTPPPPPCLTPAVCMTWWGVAGTSSWLDPEFTGLAAWILSVTWWGTTWPWWGGLSLPLLSSRWTLSCLTSWQLFYFSLLSSSSQFVWLQISDLDIIYCRNYFSIQWDFIFVSHCQTPDQVGSKELGFQCISPFQPNRVNPLHNHIKLNPITMDFIGPWFETTVEVS